ncbi:MAG TPA: 50S ribosomal protein L15 [Verrucomicrobiales bacterium]|nr:50S ribosomal protein L15 [Verrucomicrobiales bacterium]
MRLHNLRPAPGSRHRRKRLGCGESSGHGKTSGKGHKGQKARAGASIRPGFEGGQMPIHRRMPKRGFNNKTFRVRVAVVNLSGLEQKFETDAVINEAALREAGLIKGALDAVKILGNGTLTKALTLEGLRCSASARTKIEEAGGSVRLPAGAQ